MHNASNSLSTIQYLVKWNKYDFYIVEFISILYSYVYEYVL